MATKSIDPAATATTTMNIKFENPDETLTLAAPDAPTPESRTTSDSTVPSQAKPHPTTGGDEGASNGAESKPKEAEFATKSVTSLSANDVEKKVRRAERFGVPLQLSEKEKRNSRAERFGTVPGSDVAKSSEELKRKARAERFGLPENSAADEEGKKKARHSSADEEGKKKAQHSSADEEGKKKARLARFGSDAKLDSQEEEKRKARALRFAGSPLSNTNGKGNDQVKAAVTGSTVGGT